jgi:hypothetical protein
MTSNIFGLGSTLGLLGHSPIPEEEDEYESEQFPQNDNFTDPYTLAGDYIEPFEPQSSGAYVDTLNIPQSAASMISSMRRISDPYAYLNEKIDEEYHEDYEDGVVPSSSDLLAQPLTDNNNVYDPYKSNMISTSIATSTSQSYNSYPLQTKLSTIHETSSDVYLSPHDDNNYDEQITPTAYKYTENENEFIASGDLKNTNLMQNNNYAPYSTAPSTVASAVNSKQQPQPGKYFRILKSFLASGQQLGI